LTDKRYLFAAAGLHFALVATICCHDTFSALVKGETLLPRRFDEASQNTERFIEHALGQTLSKRNLFRQTVGTYVNAAGIEAGYGFFAPNIPGTNRLIFELHYGDGHVEHETPTIHGGGAELRLANLLDLIARVEDETVREGLIKYLAYAVWREHSDVASMRATLGTINFPSSGDFARGERESYHASHVYDFTFEVKPQN
jgi:hypothetical protein